jgi:hypothetical protein
VGVFNIATLPEESRRGYGTLVTLHALLDGLARGASWGFLQSSPAGYEVYRRLGFRTAESWSCFTATP